MTGSIGVSTGGTGGSVAAGGLWTFGRNDLGELGRPSGPDANYGQDGDPTPMLVTLPGAVGQVIDIAEGEEDSLVVTSTGQLYGFGSNYWGELTTTFDDWGPHPTPALVSLPGVTGAVTRVAGGNYFSLVLMSTGELYAFGYNGDGELGNATNNGTGYPNPTPALVSLPSATGPVTRIAAGSSHTLALTSTGQLYAFGANYSGQLGIASTAGADTANPTPALVSLPGATGQVVEVAAGFGHSLAATSRGELYAFGDNEMGQLGNPINCGMKTPNPTPLPVTLPGAIGPPIRLAAGMRHSLVLTGSGQLYGFGANGNAQLGPGRLGFGASERNMPGRIGLPGDPTVELMGGGSWANHTLVVISNLAVETASLPSGTKGVPYVASLQASGGIGPYSWSAFGLPVGLAVDPASGAIAGAPIGDGSYQASITVVDSRGIGASAILSLVVDPQTGIVVPAYPAGGSLPSISGDTTEGEVLTAVHGTWLNNPTGYSHQWQRCDPAGGACLPIAGATGDTYTLTAADVGHTIRVSETASNQAGAGTPLSSLPTAVVRARVAPPEAPSNTIPPAITGSAVIAQELSASTGAWSGTPPLSYSYQWQRRTPSWQDIAGATGQKYTISTSDLGRRLRVVVTATSAQGSASASSAETGDVKPNFQWPKIRHYLWTQMWPYTETALAASVLRDGGYRYRCSAPSPGELEISWYAGANGGQSSKKHPKPLLIGTGKRVFREPGSADITVKLTAAGKEVLRAGTSPELTAEATFTAKGHKQLTTTRRFALAG